MVLNYAWKIKSVFIFFLDNLLLLLASGWPTLSDVTILLDTEAPHSVSPIHPLLFGFNVLAIDVILADRGLHGIILVIEHGTD
jgi:hypothetical protein